MLEPGLFPIWFAIIVFIMFTLGMISLVTIVIIVNRNRKEKYSTNSKMILGLSSLPLIWILFEIIHYNVLLNNYNRDCIGIYYYEGTDTKVLELKEDGYWTADQIFPCSNGNWELITSEDRFYLELESFCDTKYHTEQLSLGMNNSLYLFGNRIKKR